jgi:hypothetical protein
MIDLVELRARIAEKAAKGIHAAPVLFDIIEELEHARGERPAVVAWLREVSKRRFPRNEREQGIVFRRGPACRRGAAGGDAVSVNLDDLEARIAENEKNGLYTSPAVKGLISELRELRSMRRADNEDIARAYDFARDKGQALERAAVVAWLRGPCIDGVIEEACVLAADAIERGAHRREEER